MSTVTERLLKGRRRKVGEMVRGRVLDVGFGTGLSLLQYPDGVEVVGIDASQKMLDYGRGVARRAGRDVELLVMDAERMAFPDRSFDSVAFNLCLCTIPDPERALREAVRVARPGAPIVLLEHVRSHIWPVALQEDHMNRRTADIARRAGVEIQTVDRWLLGFFNLIVGRAPGPDGPSGQGAA